jgi:hypothetical protein
MKCEESGVRGQKSEGSLIEGDSMAGGLDSGSLSHTRYRLTFELLNVPASDGE